MVAQVVDDTGGKSLVQLQSRTLGIKDKKIQIAKALGKAVAEKLKSMGIEKVVFDRSGYVYHGRVKAMAEGVREGGVKF
jgi:large subunit ribosomal protein L18